MARNEDGEFELMLGNKQLLSVFFLMVLLLALCFIGGYWLGRSAAPVVTAVNEPQVIVPPTVPSQAEPASAEKASAPPARTAPQVTEEAAKKEPEPVKAAPAPPAAKEPPAPKQTAKAEVKAKEAKAKESKADTKTKEAATKQAPTKQVAAAKAEPAAKPGPASSQPIAGRIYLQLSATDKDKAEVMVDLLRRKNFASLAAPVAERPGLFRVLVGPLAENALAQTKAQLKAGGFPGDEAIRRVF